METTPVIHDSDVIELSPDFNLLDACPVQFRFFCAADIGKSQDYTLITTIQEKRVTLKDSETIEYDVLDIVKLKKGVSFVEQAKALGNYFSQSYFKNHATRICIDASGVGAPVCDLIKDQFPELRFRPIQIVSGEGKRFNRFSRTYLINLVRAWVDKHNFYVSSDLPEANELRRQIEAVEEKETPSGNIVYGVEGHDDHIMSLALALIELDMRAQTRTYQCDIFFKNWKR